MSLSRELIVAAKARADAASEGPWRHIETPYGESVEVDDGDEGAQLFVETHGVTYAWNGCNAEFIAASREDVPVMADALLRVLDLHRQEPWIDADQFGHDRVRGVYCDECSQLWPCATVRAVTGDSIGP